MYDYIRAVTRLVAFWFCVPLAMVVGQTGNHGSLKAQAGEKVFKSACAACHGADG